MAAESGAPGGRTERAACAASRRRRQRDDVALATLARHSRRPGPARRRRRRSSSARRGDSCRPRARAALCHARILSLFLGASGTRCRAEQPHGSAPVRRAPSRRSHPPIDEVRAAGPSMASRRRSPRRAYEQRERRAIWSARRKWRGAPRARSGSAPPLRHRQLERAARAGLPLLNDERRSSLARITPAARRRKPTIGRHREREPADRARRRRRAHLVLEDRYRRQLARPHARSASFLS
jgi:hypothetical protein